MTHAAQLRPVWATDVSLNAIWAATGESPEWIAERTDTLLVTLGAALGISAWETPQHERWEGSPDALADIVRGHVTVGTFGDPEPESGYVFTLSGSSQHMVLHAQVSAGSHSTGRRVPLHTVSIDLRELVSGGVTGDIGDTLCMAVAEAWEPLALSLSDPAVNRIARRGGWKIPVGYRTWVSGYVGPIEELAGGLASRELADGTLISAPDDWSADRVVAAMTASLAANGLDEVPH
ncbi:hypothetical protein [Mycobacterium kubicae]|uniref:hypothetical protein n=1 Tax=Mycobacterium kubicae TaxID=120959 RepID=UPI0008004F17|nr:hypothetical protein [Mycobacterium kubicae]OBF24248.1 hypothetical protein A5725_06385 [Mycobacterium kubicae]OBK44942.1 hypothetical protein A5657_03860 [Mycobacterium kubicae]